MAQVTVEQIATLDPYYEAVGLLLSGDSLTTSHDWAALGVTAVGNVQVSAAQSKWGGTSLYFDGSASTYVAVPMPSKLNWGAKDFTLEMFVYKTANNPNYSRLFNPNGDVYGGLTLALDPSGNLISLGSYSGSGWDAWNFQAGIPIASNTWVHVALVRSGPVVQLFAGGVGTVLTSGLSLTTPLYFSGLDHVIGGQAGTNRNLTGYVDDVRFSINIARYTSDFTPPTAEHPWLSPREYSYRATTGLSRLGTAPPEAMTPDGPAVSVLWGELGGALKPWFSGTGTITGTVKVTPATPVARKVRLVDEASGEFVTETWSNSVTGAYTFTDINTTRKYTVLSYDHTGLYRAVIADRLIPT